MMWTSNTVEGEPYWMEGLDWVVVLKWEGHWVMGDLRAHKPAEVEIGHSNWEWAT